MSMITRAVLVDCRDALKDALKRYAVDANIAKAQGANAPGWAARRRDKYIRLEKSLAAVEAELAKLNNGTVKEPINVRGEG